MNVDVNGWAVVLAAVSSMVVGSIWYAKPVFGEIWSKLSKRSLDSMKDGGAKSMVLAFLASLVTAYVLAHMAFLANSYFGNSFLQDSLNTAFWVWLGFTAARIFTHDLFEGRPNKLTVLNMSNELATLMVMGFVIGLMKP